MSRSFRTPPSAALRVVLPLLCLVASQARAAAPALSGAGPSGKSGQTPLTLRFAALERTSGADPELPAELLRRYGRETVQATYQVCVRSDGTVMSISRRSGISDADPIIIRTLRTWRYPPQPANTMTCLYEVFEFSQ